MIFNVNPYITEEPVGGEKIFVGRIDILKAVLHVLKSPHENTIVLYGQRQVGKTSVLQEVVSRLLTKRHHAPVYFELQDKGMLSLDEILQCLSNIILHCLKIPPFVLNGDFSRMFQEEFIPHVLSHLHEKAILVFLFDEFDSMINAAESDKSAFADFFPYLNDLMSLNPGRIKFFFAIRRRREHLSEACLSLFRNATFIHVPFFSPKETGDVIHLSKQNTSLKWTEDSLSRIMELTGGHPYLTQHICRIVWERLYDDAPETIPFVRVSDIEKAVPDALRLGSNMLEQIWEGLGLAERMAASLIAEARDRAVMPAEIEQGFQENNADVFAGELEHAVRGLEEWGWIQREDKGCRMRVEILHRWIALNKPPSILQNEIRRVLGDTVHRLFASAWKFYRDGETEMAASLLEQVMRLDPRHLKANQLLIEISLAQKQSEKALELLESLYRYNPWMARPRLLQVLLSQAKENDKKKEERLVIYRRILEIEPGQSEALAKCQELLEIKGDAGFLKVCGPPETETAETAGNNEDSAPEPEKTCRMFQFRQLYRQAMGVLRRK
jgi:tetratricopeptide (TPR) repeat protein